MMKKIILRFIMAGHIRTVDHFKNNSIKRLELTLHQVIQW